MAVSKSKKRYSLYRQGVNDAVDKLSSVFVEVFSSDPRVQREDIESKLRYIQNQIKELIV
jgi:hypothetical protein